MATLFLNIPLFNLFILLYMFYTFSFFNWWNNDLNKIWHVDCFGTARDVTSVSVRVLRRHGFRRIRLQSWRHQRTGDGTLAVTTSTWDNVAFNHQIFFLTAYNLFINKSFI